MTSFATAQASPRRLYYQSGMDSWVEQGAARAVCSWLAGVTWSNEYDEPPWYEEETVWHIARTCR